jgi:hypothetical protein
LLNMDQSWSPSIHFLSTLPPSATDSKTLMRKDDREVKLEDHTETRDGNGF